MKVNETSLRFLKFNNNVRVRVMLTLILDTLSRSQTYNIIIIPCNGDVNYLVQLIIMYL